MRKITFFAGLSLAIAVLLPGSALSAAGGSDLPFQGSTAGYGTTNVMTGQSHLVTTGQWSHFGSVTVEQDMQLTFTLPTFTYVGTWTATAANGDQMSGTSAGSGRFTDPAHTTTQGTYTSSAGTGRFANASLSFAVSVQGTRVSVAVPMVTSFFEVTLDGQLSYR